VTTDMLRALQIVVLLLLLLRIT